MYYSLSAEGPVCLVYVQQMCPRSYPTEIRSQSALQLSTACQPTFDIRRIHGFCQQSHSPQAGDIFSSPWGHTSILEWYWPPASINNPPGQMSSTTVKQCPTTATSQRGFVVDTKVHAPSLSISHLAGPETFTPHHYPEQAGRQARHGNISAT